MQFTENKVVAVKANVTTLFAQARSGDPGQGGAVSVGPIWHACIAIRPAKHRPHYLAHSKLSGSATARNLKIWTRTVFFAWFAFLEKFEEILRIQRKF